MNRYETEILNEIFTEDHTGNFETRFPIRSNLLEER